MSLNYEQLTSKKTDNISLGIDYKFKTPFKVEKDQHFIYFDKHKRFHEFNNKINTSWKVHLSIHPDDLSRAWDDVIWPILKENAINFKVVNDIATIQAMRRNQSILVSVQHSLAQLRGGLVVYENDKNADVDKYQALIDALEQEYVKGRRSHKITDRQHYSMVLIKDSQARILNKFRVTIAYLECLLPEVHEAIESNVRMEKGMQVTIYIPEGQEEKYQTLSEQLDIALMQYAVRPGEIYHTDEAMSQYCSRRHPGVNKYTDAIAVTHYNPDAVPDKLNALVSAQVMPILHKLTQIVHTLQKEQPFPIETTNTLLREIDLIAERCQLIIESYKGFNGEEPINCQTTLNKLEKQLISPLLSTLFSPETTVNAVKARDLSVEGSDAADQERVVRLLGG